MVTQEDLAKRVSRLKKRIQRAGEEGEGPLPPDGIRRFRKRLKRTQRKLAARAARAEKQMKAAPAQEKPAEAKAVEEKATEEKAPEESTSGDES